MKKYWIIILLLLTAQVGAIDLGKKLALRLVSFPLNPAIDTGLLNVQKWPDSASIAVWATSGADTGNTTSQVVFGTSTTTVTAAGLAALGIRTDSVGTNTPMFVLCDTLRILNAGTTTRQLAGQVSLWRLGCPFTTQFSVYVCGDTLLDSMRAVGTVTTTTTTTTATNLTNTVTLAAGQFTKIKDTTIAAMPTVTLAPGQFTKIKDTTIAAFPTVTLAAGQFTKIKDTTIAAIPVEWTAAQRDSILAVLADANTKLKAKLLAVTDTLGNTSSSLRVDTNTVWTTTQRDSILANLVDANAKLKAKLLAITDTLGNTSSSLRVDTNTVWSTTQRDSVLANLVDANAKLKAKLLAITDTLGNTSSSLRVDTNTVWSTTQRDSMLTVLADANAKLKAKLLAITDTLANTSSSLRVDTNTVWSTTQRDSILANLADANTRVKVKLAAILDTLQNTLSALRVDTNTVWSTTQRDSILGVFTDANALLKNRLLRLRDSLDATLDTLQNASSNLRASGSGLDSATTSRILGRKLWGIAAGSGSDSTTRAQRKTDIVDTTYMLIGCDTSNSDFLLTMTDYRNQIKRKVGVDISNTTWQTDSVLNQLIREAVVTVNPIIRGYKTTLRKVTQYDSSDYSLDSLVGVTAVQWKHKDSTRSLTYKNRNEWASITVQNTYGAGDPYTERPIVYDYTDATLTLFPTPTSSDTILIFGFQKIPNITVASQVSEIPQKYRVAILKYATWLVARAKQHPMTQTYLDEYHESIAFLMVELNRATDVKK